MQASAGELLTKKYRLGGGPQADRDMKWIMNDSELLQPHGERDDLNIDRQSERKA